MGLFLQKCDREGCTNPVLYTTPNPQKKYCPKHTKEKGGRV